LHYNIGSSNGYGGVCYIGCNANELNDRVLGPQQVPTTPLDGDPDSGGWWDAGTCADRED